MLLELVFVCRLPIY
ncbi:hypothetical protein RDABS01_036237 [Bienertia sinuspersici]